MAFQTPKARPTARGLTLLAVIALLACASPGESRESRRDGRVGARLALASAGVIVGLLSHSVHAEASPAQHPETVVLAGASDALVTPSDVADLRPRDRARRGLLDLPPPTA